MVRSLIDIYRHEGFMPDCRMSLCKGDTQGGSNGDVVLADAFVKNVTKLVNYDDAFDAVLADAEKEPKSWLVQGRGHLDDWRDLGYIRSTGGGRSVSRAVEYGYDDYCIAEMALIRGQKEDAKKYLARSRNWLNHFVPSSQSLISSNLSDPDAPMKNSGFSGFLQPRITNGSFGEQDPILCSPLMDFHACYFDTRHATYEGSLWLYTFLAAPGDMATLVEKLGGPETFTKRLDFFHESGILDIGDEQSFLTVFMYHYAGRPGLSAKRVHSYIPTAFNASHNGLPGKCSLEMKMLTCVD
jgi:putative alpha-1,2-mannosidase